MRVGPLIIVALLSSQAMGSEMVSIPAGAYVPFSAGSARQPVQMSAYQMDAYPVSTKDFQRFVQTHPEWRRSKIPTVFAESGYLKSWRSDLNPGRALDAPATQVSWFAAKAYCESSGKSLPSTDQWEFAIDDGGKGKAEAAERSIAWFGKPTESPAMRSRANGYGIHGLYDLVWEWTEDFAGASLSSDPSKVADSRFVCGGASVDAVDPSDYAAFMRYSYRESLKANYVTANLGFRCVSTLPAAAEARAPEAELPSDSLYRLDSHWRDQAGREATLAQFKGKPLILAMIYTRCQASCPLIVSDMKRIESSLPGQMKAQVRFALFSFDSDGDKPERLKAFAEAHGLDLARWTLFSGKTDQIRNLASALSVRYKKVNPELYVHSNGITILDPEGVPRYVLDKIGAGPEEQSRVLAALAPRP